MKVEKLEPSKHRKGRILVFLEDGSLLKVTERELLDFDLRPGETLDDETLTRLRAAACCSDAKAQAAAMAGGCTGAASVTLLFINLYHFSNHIRILRRLGLS